MALGKAGSSLTAELNRLAGTTGRADQGAANAYKWTWNYCSIEYQG